MTGQAVLFNGIAILICERVPCSERSEPQKYRQFRSHYFPQTALDWASLRQSVARVLALAGRYHSEPRAVPLGFSDSPKTVINVVPKPRWLHPVGSTKAVCVRMAHYRFGGVNPLLRIFFSSAAMPAAALPLRQSAMASTVTISGRVPPSPPPLPRYFTA
jgi:hypothetical protein